MKEIRMYNRKEPKTVDGESAMTLHRTNTYLRITGSPFWAIFLRTRASIEVQSDWDKGHNGLPMVC